MNKMYVVRRLESEVVALADYFPAIVVIGPRQVGKTSLVQAVRNQVDHHSTYLDLERPEDLSAIDDLEAYAEGRSDQLIILDEVQRKPTLFPELRSVIDRNRRPGRFILLGSASLDLIRDTSESLAGRIAILELTGLRLDELAGIVEWRRHWLRGSYPQSVLADTDEISTVWREFFIATYLQRDLAGLGLTFSASGMGKLFTMLAHLTGQLLNLQSLGKSLELDKRTVGRYLDFLEETFMIRRLPPYYINISKRLTKSPKLYLRDTGLLHQRLGIVTDDDLVRHPIKGASFESYVVEQVYARKPRSVSLYFYRTYQGAEVDLVLVKGGVPYAAVEIKNAARPRPGKGFYTAADDLKVTRRYVITGAVTQPYSLKSGGEVLGLQELDRIF